MDGAGNAYVAGFTNSANFPTANALQPVLHGGVDAFVTKLNAAGSGPVYSTYLGGSGDEYGNAIAVDAGSNAYVTGFTSSADFPTASPLQAAYGGGYSDGFVAKLNAAGSGPLYSTYLGGSGDDSGHGIAVDAVGNAYVTGYTASVNFPTAASAFQSFLGGGEDVFAAKLNPAGSVLAYSTYLGGSGDDVGNAIVIDAGGNAYLTGFTSSVNFPTANALQSVLGGPRNAFVTKLNPAGSGLVFSTYLGGNGDSDFGFGIRVDTVGNAYVSGSTTSANFPTTSPWQPGLGGDFD
ncbi:MAG: SBBP repeat-containing protein, partial [Nanoarchaeota archaeon]